MCKNSHFTHIDCGEKNKEKKKRKKIPPYTPLIKKKINKRKKNNPPHFCARACARFINKIFCFENSFQHLKN